MGIIVFVFGDLFVDLKRRHIGTTEVESMSKRICFKLPSKRCRTLVDIIMKCKIDDARKEMNKARYNNTQVWRNNRQHLVDMNIINQFNDVWSFEKEVTRTNLCNKRKKKVDFLSIKYNKKNNAPDKIRGVIVADQDIVKDFSMAPRIYGGVELSSEEEQLLTLPPKFTIPELIDQIECQTEVEKITRKAKMGIAKRT